MAYDEEKEKSHKDLWGLKNFYFICVIRAPYYQEECIEWVAEVQNIENYLPTKILRNQIYGLRLSHVTQNNIL
jgi:hypothetical protein